MILYKEIENRRKNKISIGRLKPLVIHLSNR